MLEKRWMFGIRNTDLSLSNHPHFKSALIYEYINILQNVQFHDMMFVL